MVNFPASTIVDRRVPKQSFYDNISISPGLKRAFVDQISLIIWRNKLAESTLAISAGKDIREIQVFELQLRQKQKLESIGTLAGGVAHEINNPINGIINYAELIEDGNISPEQVKIFSQGIIHEGKRIAEIVKNLLSFARQEKHLSTKEHLVVSYWRRGVAEGH